MLEAITGIFTGMGTWFVTLFNSISSVFWEEGTDGAAGHLTFVGTLAIIAVAIGLVFTLIRIVRGFMHLKG